MDQRALASGGKILRRNGDGKGRYLVSGRDQRAQPSADGRERSGARRSELHGRPRFCAARRATAAGRSPGGGVARLDLLSPPTMTGIVIPEGAGCVKRLLSSGFAGFRAPCRQHWVRAGVKTERPQRSEDERS